MQLGTNFRHAPAYGIGFNLDAARALRPAVVRHVLQDPQNIGEWLKAARSARVQVLWCVPLERLRPGGAQAATRAIANYGIDVTAGIEFGDRPWEYQQPAAAYLEQLEACLDITVPSGAFRRGRPVLVGAGFDGSAPAARFIGELLAVAAGRRVVWHQGVHGFAFQPIAPGRPIGTCARFVFRGLQARLIETTGLPVSFVRVGWQAGERLPWGAAAREAVRTWWTGPLAWSRELGESTRVRWQLDAFEFARRLGALHYLVDADPDRSPGRGRLNEWGLYDGRTQRADPLWLKLQWRALQVQGSEGPRAEALGV